MTPLRRSRSARTLSEPLQAMFFPRAGKRSLFESLALILERAGKDKGFRLAGKLTDGHSQKHFGCQKGVRSYLAKICSGSMWFP
jgi:hypothetical protein